MRHRTLRIAQLDAKRKPIGEPVFIAIDAATEYFDWTLDDPKPHCDDPAAGVPPRLPQPPG